MKLTVAVILVVVSMVAADPPNRPRVSFSRQTRLPTAFLGNGFRSQRLEAAPAPQPHPSYGPPPAAPPASYGPPEVPEEPTTTEAPTTTETTQETTTVEPQAENIRIDPRTNKVRSSKQQQQPGQFFFVLPQSQNLIYAVQQNAPLVSVPRSNFVAIPRENLVAVPRENFVSVPRENLVTVQRENLVAVPRENLVVIPRSNLVSLPRPNTVGSSANIENTPVSGPRPAPLQAVPALSRFQDVPRAGRLQFAPVVQPGASAATSSVLTPFSASFVEVVQQN